MTFVEIKIYVEGDFAQIIFFVSVNLIKPILISNFVYRYAVTAAFSESLPIRTPATACATPSGAAHVSTPAQCATPCGAAYVSTPAHSAWKMFSAHLSDVSGMSSEHEQVER